MCPADQTRPAKDFHLQSSAHARHTYVPLRFTSRAPRRAFQEPHEKGTGARSGCTFSFYQRKIEWARLMEEHPDEFEEAKPYEKNALDDGSPLNWSQGESVVEMSTPDRIVEIRADHDARRTPHATG
jgi:hypothetical protein